MDDTTPIFDELVNSFPDLTTKPAADEPPVPAPPIDAPQAGPAPER